MIAVRFGLLVTLWHGLAAGSAYAEECDTAVQRVITATGATLKRQTEMGNFHLSHPLASSLVVSCGDLVPFGVSVGFDGSRPPNGFFDLVGSASSSLIGEAQEAATRTAQQCHREALADRDGLGYASSPRAEFECGEWNVNVFRPQQR